MKHSRLIFFRWLNGLAFLAMVAVNALAQLKPLGGVKTGEVSDRYANLFTPAAYTFAIWGAVYLLLAGFVLYQCGALRKGGGRSAELVARVGWWFAASCAFNAAWICLWHYDIIGLSALATLGLLVSLAVLTHKTRDDGAPKVDRLLGQAPFSLYFGWVTVALIANATVWLVSAGWSGWGVSQRAWTVVMLAVGALLACATILRRNDWVYGLAVMWGYAGVLWRHISARGYGAAYPEIVATAAAALAAMGGAMVWAEARKARRVAR